MTSIGVRFAALAFACACACSAAAMPLPSHAGTADARFEALYTREWAWRVEQQAGDEDEDGPVRPHLPDVSAQAQQMRLRYLTGIRRELDAIPFQQLTPSARVNFSVYSFQIDTLLARLRYREYEKPLNADTSFWGNFGYVARRPFRTEDDYRNFIAQMREIPVYFREQIVNMRAGLARGFTPPRVTLEGREASITSISDAAGPRATLFYTPFETMPSSIPAARQAQYRAEAEAVIAQQVIPAYRSLLAFMRDEYLPGARTTLAAQSLPDGSAYYQSLIHEFTTLDLTADQIHAIGLEQVAAIRAQMEAVIREVNFHGDLAAFLHFLRTDPRFYATTPEQLLREAAWIAKEFDGKASTWFGRLPRARFAVRPVPADLAPFYTSGRGGPGVYLVNTYDLRSRPLYALRALTLHESAPGHAFQMPLADENVALPAFRRRVYISAYGEGWALYAEKLGVEMGMYETPYDRFGMLSYQMWRAARLVVDTGIHAKGWTREQAQHYLLENTALAPHEVETEVDRYIAWPGQALSYYLGEMSILRSRARAEAALGERFDIRAFHDTILELGSVPLPVLEARIDHFIAEGGRSPYATETGRPQQAEHPRPARVPRSR
jgi:uncharacterized protein (DUF885 family)